MKIVKWIPQILLSLLFLLAGGYKLFTPYENLIEVMSWITEVGPFIVKLIGLLEVLGALGLVLPMVFNKYPVLVPVAALCLAVTMVVAMIVHLSRGEPIIFTVVLGILCLLVVWWRRDFFRPTA